MGFLVRAKGSIVIALISGLSTFHANSVVAAEPAQATSGKPLQGRSMSVLPPELQLPHERTPTSWPQQDYFSEALKLTGFNAEDPYKSLVLRADQYTKAVPYVVLPVQTQAFGFSNVFRAVIGAEIDRQLAGMGIRASRQIDVVGAGGPYVRRFDDATLKAFSAEHPAQKLIAFYLGHDGARQAFLDVTVSDIATRSAAHRIVALPEDPVQAMAAISGLIPDLLIEAGLKRAKAGPDGGDGKFACTDASWRLEDLPVLDNGAKESCRALVIGTLLPDYEAEAVGLGATMSPAKLAWLARAYVIAKQSASMSSVARAVQNLSLRQMEVASVDTAPVAYVGATDPVVSRIGKLLSVWERSARNPSRSEPELVDKFLADATQGMPDFARAVAIERVNFRQMFRQVDFCEIERAFPGPVMNSHCRNPSKSLGMSAAGSVPQVKSLIYQEWRMARSYKELVHYGLALGRGDRLKEAVAALPSDLANQPFIQRLRYMLKDMTTPKNAESFDEFLARKRMDVTRFVQSTVNLQGRDRWLAAYSVSEHAWTRNVNLLNDPQIDRATTAEGKLITVLNYDRFVPGSQAPVSRREPGEPAYFLRPVAVTTVEASKGKELKPLSPEMEKLLLPPKRMLFEQHQDSLDQPSVQSLQEKLKNDPQDMFLRARLGTAMLKDGRALADVLKLFNAHPINSRDGASVAESHAWAAPAHVLYLSGEVDAARPFYEKVRSLGTGSESDMLANVRVNLIDGKVTAATKATETRLDRYESEFARRDLMGLWFMTKRTSNAWDVFRAKAITAKDLEFWFGASVGHRLEGRDLPGIKTWLEKNNLNQVQIDFTGIEYLYLHLMAVLDRLPSDADIQMLQDRREKRGSKDARWTMSAILIQGALAGSDPKRTYARVTEEAASPYLVYGGNDFMLPFYVWTAAQANPKDPYLDDVRKATARWDFNHTLAKSMLLAAEGNTAESLKFFHVSRYELANLTWGRNGGIVNYRLPLPYQYALAGYLMYRKTGVTAYRDSVLAALNGFERASPYFAWSYNLQALLETDKTKRTLATCRGRFLDPNSYFLSQLKDPGKVSCPAMLW